MYLHGYLNHPLWGEKKNTNENENYSPALHRILYSNEIPLGVWEVCETENNDVCVFVCSLRLTDPSNIQNIKFHSRWPAFKNSMAQSFNA